MNTRCDLENLILEKRWDLCFLSFLTYEMKIQRNKHSLWSCLEYFEGMIHNLLRMEPLLLVVLRLGFLHAEPSISVRVSHALKTFLIVGGTNSSQELWLMWVSHCWNVFVWWVMSKGMKLCSQSFDTKICCLMSQSRFGRP